MMKKQRGGGGGGGGGPVPPPPRSATGSKLPHPLILMCLDVWLHCKRNHSSYRAIKFAV